MQRAGQMQGRQHENELVSSYVCSPIYGACCLLKGELGRGMCLLERWLQDSHAARQPKHNLAGE